jgi:hypothetical protein
VPPELAFQLRDPRRERLDHPGLLGVGRPQLRNGRRLDHNGRTKISSRIGEQVTASGTSSGHARLPMGLPESYPTTPLAVNPPTTPPKALNSYGGPSTEARPTKRDSNEPLQSEVI